MFFDPTPCHCGSGRRFSHCCGPVLDGAPAVTAEALMRSRYTAHVVGDVDHLLRSWHPSTRPASVEITGPDWLGLEIVEVVDGGADDERGEVTFEARYSGGGVERRLRERSQFVREAGRWLYVGPLPLA